MVKTFLFKPDKSREIHMNTIDDAILNYLKMETTGSLLLSGFWGAGKTYHLKKKSFPLIEQAGYIPIIVSLYGENSRAKIAEKVMLAYLDKFGSKHGVKTSSIIEGVKRLTEIIPGIEKWVDVDKLITGSGEGWFNFINHDNLLICFDDLERLSPELKVNDFLGAINDLVENKGCKVILIANEKQIKGGIGFKEKTIEKTIFFEPNHSEVFDNIIKVYQRESEYSKYLNSEKDFILSTLEADSLERKEVLHNIRTLKFVLEHFKYPFNVVNKIPELDEKLKKRILKNIWLFNLSISIEYKKPDNISFNDRKHLENKTVSISEFNWEAWNGQVSNVEPKDKEELSPQEEFVENYYTPHDEEYFFYDELYDHITGNIAINEENLIKIINEYFNSEDGKELPSHYLLRQFMQERFWRLEEEELPNKLKELFQYTEAAEFNDVVAYINASYILFDLQELSGLSNEKILKGVSKGISKFFTAIKIDYMLKSQIELILETTENKWVNKVMTLIKTLTISMDEIQKQEEVDELKNLFVGDFLEFINKITDEIGDLTTPNKVIFNDISNLTLSITFSSWTPEDFMTFSDFVKTRYVENGFAERLQKEIPFLKECINKFEALNLNKTLARGHIYHKYILPALNDAIQELEKTVS